MFLVECNGSNIFNLSYLGMLLLEAACRYKGDVFSSPAWDSFFCILAHVVATYVHACVCMCVRVSMCINICMQMPGRHETALEGHLFSSEDCLCSLAISEALLGTGRWPWKA